MKNMVKSRKGGDSMEYLFFNKNTPVFSFEMYHGKILKILENFNPEYRPIQVKFNKKQNKIEKSSFEAFVNYPHLKQAFEVGASCFYLRCDKTH